MEVRCHRGEGPRGVLTLMQPVLRLLKALYRRSPPRVRVAAQKVLWCANVLATLEFSSFRRLEESIVTVWLSLRVRNYTMEHPPRLKTLYRLCREIDALNVSGDIVECGVWNGGAAAMMAYCTKQSRWRRTIWLFDSFDGMPPPTIEDGDRAAGMFQQDWIVGHVSRVQEVFRKLRIPAQSVHIVKGWFEETFPSVDIRRIALLHVDADWYQSVKICLEKFYDAVQPGGIVVLDDYSYWDGCRKATHEFIATHRPMVELQSDGSVHLRKPSQPFGVSERWHASKTDRGGNDSETPKISARMEDASRLHKSGFEPDNQGDDVTVATLTYCGRHDDGRVQQS